MQKIDTGKIGTLAGCSVEKGAVNAQFHVFDAGADKDLARYMAQETTFHIGAEFRVERGNGFLSFAVIGNEGLEIAETSAEGFCRADPRNVLGLGQGSKRICNVIGWPEEFVDIDMGKPVDLGPAPVGMGRIAGLADLVLGRALDAASFPVLRVALSDADLGVVGKDRFGLGAGRVEIEVEPVAAEFEMMRGKAEDGRCIGLYSRNEAPSGPRIRFFLGSSSQVTGP